LGWRNNVSRQVTALGSGRMRTVTTHHRQGRGRKEKGRGQRGSISEAEGGGRSCGNLHWLVGPRREGFRSEGVGKPTGGSLTRTADEIPAKGRGNRAAGVQSLGSALMKKSAPGPFAFASGEIAAWVIGALADAWPYSCSRGHHGEVQWLAVKPGPLHSPLL
jgi:hypothetical protein